MEVEQIFPHTSFLLLGVEVRDSVVVTWVIMGLLAVLSFVATHRLRDRPGAIQNAAEAVLEVFEGLLGELTSFPPRQFIPFIGTLGLFLVLANTVSIIPGVGSPTRDLNTTLALAVIVFFSVHYFGWKLIGPKQYLKTYVEPFWLLLPFNIIGEISRTIALALRLFGNMLSGDLIVAVLLLLAGLIVPVAMQIFGILIGLIQAYVFTLLAMVYIAAALQRPSNEESEKGGES